ncbi:hypothetical protein BDV96DRAFT_566568 [Lophiotrema nucula]|uniref:Secreted protein n=1 Tax=Lophiotrema nucula TaxID=690887 RepID=A0A6A5ZKZ0_9PLEO|nr:hypothetical protein BDV96DRAFT_566568 [Lophiotrema nucula]
MQFCTSFVPKLFASFCLYMRAQTQLWLPSSWNSVGNSHSSVIVLSSYVPVVTSTPNSSPASIASFRPIEKLMLP